MEGTMANKKDISSLMTVKDLLETHPRLLPMFLDMGLLCVGCPAESFHTLAEVAEEYKLDLHQLLNRMNKSVSDDALSP
jgi:hybrid cluster-associated redox disulfide protein